MGSPANITNRSKADVTVYPPPYQGPPYVAVGLGEQPSITNDDPTKEPAWLSDKTHSAHVAALLQACARPDTPYPHADSVTDRDPGDESRADVDGWYAKAGRDAARIADLEAEIARLHQAHERYVAAQQTLANNACDWRDAEIERLRAALAAAQPTVKESPNPFANALTHGWATARYPTERDDLR